MISNMSQSRNYGAAETSQVSKNETATKSHFLKFSTFLFTLGSITLFGTAINQAYSGMLQRYFAVDFDETLNGMSNVKWTLYRKGYSPLNYFTSDASSFLKYKFLEKYAAVIEPYAQMYLYVEDFDSSTADTYFYIEVCKIGSDVPCLKGSLQSNGLNDVPVKIYCEPFDVYNISVVQYDNEGVATGYSDTREGVCMYVRREFRALSESDLDATMDAMATLWYTSEEKGQHLYGSNFHNSTYIASAHYFGASQQDADHIHEGLGFMLQHIKLTNVFELAMQSVDPSVSLPYWDFTIDTAEGTSIYDLVIFQENTFGTLTPAADDFWGWTYRNNSLEDARIPDGRWANVLSERNIWYPELKAAYSYIRAPWNMNPSKYITRFAADHAFPSCGSYYDWLKKSNLMLFLKYAPGPPHASTHGNVGGSFGCDYLDWMTESGMLESVAMQKALCSKWGFKMKDLYRLNFIVPKSSCVQDEEAINNSQCGFDCSKALPGEMLDALNETMGSYFPDNSASDWLKIKEFICYGDGYKVFFGDHLESASAADPSFWSIHPTMERAMQAKFMAGGFDTTEWYTDFQEQWICGRNECYEEDKGPDKAYYSTCCFGHYKDDGIIDYVNGNKSNSLPPTNQEVIEYTDPTNKNYKMNYIYDSFSWTHCEDGRSSHDIDSLLENMYLKAVVLNDDDSVDVDPFSYLDALL